ncbi:MAG TPA: ribokinase [Sphingobium sp.]
MIQTPARPIFVLGSLVAACCARVARCPEPGETLRATDFLLEPGGKGFNVALAAHRLQVPVDGLFAVGDDLPGALMRASFARLGLREEMIETVGVPTGAGVGLIQADGENRIAVFPGANEALTAAHVAAREHRLRDAAVVFAQFEVSDEPIAAAFALARAAGIATILNPSPYRPISPEILAATDIMIVNENEAAQLARDCDSPGSFDRLAAVLAPRTLIVTRGAQGALVWIEGEHRLEQPGLVVDVVDSIGAGDAFAGGVIAALARGLGLATALQWGCGAGALAVVQMGLIDALPDVPALDAVIRAA